jgi:predicted RNA-binding protein with PUA-like domain
MGIMKVIEEAHQDKTTDDERWVSVTFEPQKSIVPSIPLVKVKASQELGNIGLIKQPRLSVMKLSEAEYDIIISMSQ